MPQLSVLWMAQKDVRRRLLRLFSPVPQLPVHRRVRFHCKTSLFELFIPTISVVDRSSGLESRGDSSWLGNNTTQDVKVEGQLTTDMPSEDICPHAQQAPPSVSRSWWPIFSKACRLCKCREVPAVFRDVFWLVNILSIGCRYPRLCADWCYEEIFWSRLGERDEESRAS